VEIAVIYHNLTVFTVTKSQKKPKKIKNNLQKSSKNPQKLSKQQKKPFETLYKIHLQQQGSSLREIYINTFYSINIKHSSKLLDHQSHFKR
jgi:hypothetical protein